MSRHKKSKKMKKLLLFINVAVLLCSCNTGSRMEKKMLSRLSADEIDAASGYIYPGDQAAFAFFVEEVLPCCDNVYFEATEIKSMGNGDYESLQVTYKIHNHNDALIRYFSSIGKNISNSGIMIDTVNIVTTKDGKKLSFSWGIPNVDNDNLLWASLPEEATVENMNVRQQPSVNSKIIGKLKKGQHLVIDRESSNSEWVHAYWITSYGECANGYIKNKSLVIKKQATYSPSIFDSFIFLLIAVIIGVLFVVFIIPMLFEVGGCWGWIIAIIVVLGVIYALYEFIEKVLFEMFIINIPY